MSTPRTQRKARRMQPNSRSRTEHVCEGCGATGTSHLLPEGWCGCGWSYDRQRTQEQAQTQRATHRQPCARRLLNFWPYPHPHAERSDR